MKTPAQLANDAKVRLQRVIVARLRKRGQKMLPSSWDLLMFDKKLWEEIEAYDLAAPSRRSHLSKVAFPDFNHAEVDAALKSGNSLNDLYSIACGKKTIAKNAEGKYLPGKKGHLKRQLRIRFSLVHPNTMPDSKPTTQQQSVWITENFRALRRDVNNQLAVIMALAELSQRNSACYPKLSAAILERCPSIVRLFQAATSEDPETFERNRLEELRSSFKDTPPHFPSRDDSISFWSLWLSSVESYPYRVPVPNHLREAHKWLSLAQRDHLEARADLVSRVEALLPPEQLDQTRLDSEAFIRGRQ